MKPTVAPLFTSKANPARSTAAALMLAAAGGLLASAPSASAQTFNESSAPGSDFGNSFAARTVLTLGTTMVNGGSNSSSDPDFFSFIGLTSGTPYSLSISAGGPTLVRSTFQGFDGNGSPIGTSASYSSNDSPNTLKMISGTVPTGGVLTIGISPQNVEGGSTNYAVTLSAVPEPSSTVLVALGAAVAALAARRSRKSANPES